MIPFYPSSFIHYNIFSVLSIAIIFHRLITLKIHTQNERTEAKKTELYYLITSV